MAKGQSTSLNVEPRGAAHSRATRRLRREGRVPGVLYGMGDEPQAFSVDARELRLALAGRGAVLDVALGGETTSAVLKDSQLHPVRGDVLHVDLLRVDLNKPIQSPVPLHLTGVEESPGVKEGGVLEQVTREVTVEALPNDIPEELVHDVSHMEMLGTELLSAVQVPSGVTSSTTSRRRWSPPSTRRGSKRSPRRSRRRRRWSARTASRRPRAKRAPRPRAATSRPTATTPTASRSP